MTTKALPRDITPGMWTPRLVGSGMNLRVVWRQIEEVRYLKAQRRYYIRVTVPEHLWNYEGRAFYVGPRVRVEVSETERVEA